MTGQGRGSMADRANPIAARAVHAALCATAQLALLPPVIRLIIRGDRSALALMGMTTPDTCRATIDGDQALLWLGPDEFLLLLPEDATQAVEVQQSGSVVNVSHRDIAISVSGSRAARMINAFCALDLHPTNFPVGMCTRTLFGKAQIVLWRTQAEAFRIEVARSFAPYVWDCLEEARREFLA